MSSTCDSSTFKHRVLKVAPLIGCFDAGDYVEMNADLASVDPFDHFADHGVWEGRKAIRAERLTAKLSHAVMLAEIAPLEAPAMERGYRGAIKVRPTIHLPVAPTHREELIAVRLVAAFDAVGVDARIVRGAPSARDERAILIGPDRLFQGAKADADLGLYAASIVVVSDAPHSAGFVAQAPYILGAAGVIAVDADTYVLFRDAGVPVAWFGGAFFDRPRNEPVPDHPLVEGLGREICNAPADLPWAERPIDVLALNATSPTRTSAWARMAAGLARFRTIVYAPVAGDVSDEAEAALRRFLYARSKIVLHLHEAAPHALRGCMIEEAAAAGALLVSEPCPAHPIIRPDRHYFEVSARRLPHLIDTLIGSDEGRESATAAIRACRRTLASMFDLESAGLALVNLLTDAAERGE